MRIDPHVHCRDWNQAYKSTVRYVYGLAVSQGVGIIFDMPNTDPPIISENDVAKRLALAKDFPGYYLFIGATKNPSQLREAARVATTNPRVVGIKMYATGVGDLAITNAFDQAQVYDELSKCGYKGVLAVHCEKESLFKPALWDPQRPYTWNDARPEISEVESAKDQIEFAKRAEFEGVLHICHVSSPRTVEMISKAGKEIRIACGVTPHHLMYSTDDMKDARGLRYKVNPPIRSPGCVEGLWRCLASGMIDWIETDHAPHTDSEKTNPPGASGIPSLRYYSQFLEKLRTEGFSEDQITDLTYSNIKRVFSKIPLC